MKAEQTYSDRLINWLSPKCVVIFRAIMRLNFSIYPARSLRQIFFFFFSKNSYRARVTAKIFRSRSQKREGILSLRDYYAAVPGPKDERRREILTRSVHRSLS